jgi:hypothetical protein
MGGGIEEMKELLKTFQLIEKRLDNHHQLNLAFTLAQEEYSYGVLKVETLLGLMSVGLILHAPCLKNWRLFFSGEMRMGGVKCRVPGEEIALTDKTWVLVGEVARPRGLDLIGFLLDPGSFI